MRNGYLDYAGYQKQAKWTNTLFDVQDSPGMRMGILGYGAIGRQCARLANAMGVEVYAFTRSERSTPEQRRDDSYCLPGMGDPDGLIPTKWFHGSSKDAVNEFLGQDLDILVLCLPLTETTKSIIGREQFEILAKNKKKTFLSNVARGKHVDTDALVEALHQGQIRGAALDVTDPEPLPDGHPLFTAPNVFITPHIGWRTPNYFKRILAIVEANLEILNNGDPVLNAVNREHHY
jgi:phosphoglycerate dehydrogenase-like enzyme